MVKNPCAHATIVPGDGPRGRLGTEAFDVLPRHASRPDGQGWRSVVEAFQVPGPFDAVQIDQCEPPIARNLEVVAGDRSTPPGLLDPPAVADLDRLATAVPADRDERAGTVQLGLDRRVATQETGHDDTPPPPDTTGRHAQRVSGSGASGSVMATRRTRSSPNLR